VDRRGPSLACVCLPLGGATAALGGSPLGDGAATAAGAWAGCTVAAGAWAKWAFSPHWAYDTEKRFYDFFGVVRS
jgi:hypothetical protein